ncbi:MAG: hypothetical protein GX895_00125 [Clostridiales bacterium]|nr:hypothetical protein [Clostridiales bacterium]
MDRTEQDILDLLKDPFFGLCEIKKEVQAIESATLNSSYGLKAIESKIAAIESNLLNFSTVIEEIKNNNVQNYTTGIVAADRSTKSLIAIVNNNTAKDQIVTINVLTYYYVSQAPDYKPVFQNRGIVQKIQPTNGNDENIVIAPKSTIISVYNLAPSNTNAFSILYEVQYLGLVEGVTTYTATRNVAPQEGIENSSWIPSNVYRHSDLIPL